MTTLRYSKMLFMAIWIAYPASDLRAVQADASVRYLNDLKLNF